MEVTVWLDEWQQQCCGEPFAVGDQVAWTLRRPDAGWLAEVLGAEVAARVDAAEEHHGRTGPDTPTTVGTVASIEAVHCRYAARPDGPARTLHPVPGSGEVSAVEVADGRPPDRDGLGFAGYLVQLTGAWTRPSGASSGASSG